MNKLAIIGCGHLGQLIAHHAINCDFSIYGFFDDWNKPGTETKHGKVIGNTDSIIQHFKENHFQYLMIGIGYNHFKERKFFYNKFSKKEIPFAKIIHPSCYVDPDAIIEPGCFLLPGCVIDTEVTLKENVLLNTGCTVAHDTTIGSHSFLGPRVALAGFIEVGECCMLGINTTVIDNIKICDDVKTGGGAVVVKNIIEKGTYVGIPAIKIK